MYEVVNVFQKDISSLKLAISFLLQQAFCPRWFISQKFIKHTSSSSVTEWGSGHCGCSSLPSTLRPNAITFWATDINFGKIIIKQRPLESNSGTLWVTTASQNAPINCYLLKRFMIWSVCWHKHNRTMLHKQLGYLVDPSLVHKRSSHPQFLPTPCLFFTEQFWGLLWIIYVDLFLLKNHNKKVKKLKYLHMFILLNWSLVKSKWLVNVSHRHCTDHFGTTSMDPVTAWSAHTMCQTACRIGRHGQRWIATSDGWHSDLLS